MASKSCLIIDDSQISRAFLKGLFEGEGWRVIATFSSLLAASQTIYNERPELISLDFNLNRGTALDQLKKVKNTFSTSEILFVTEEDDIRNLIRMYESSASGIGSKGNIESLKKIIRSTSKGIRCYDENIANRLLQYHIDSKQLSLQEKTTFVGLMSGDSINVVSERLNISDRTVWKHRRKIIEKLGRSLFARYCPRMIAN